MFWKLKDMFSKGVALSGANAFRVATALGGFFAGVVTWLISLWKGITGQFVSSLSWWTAAVTAVKIMAQFAVWFLSGGYALIATVVATLASFVSSGINMIGVHKCFNDGSLWHLNWTKFHI